MVSLRVNHTQSFRLKSKIQNSRSIQLMIYSLFSFFCRLFGNITDVSIANETEDWTRKRFNQSYHPDEGNCYQDCIKSKLGLIYQNRRLKAKRKQMLSRGLFGRFFLSARLVFKHFQLSRQKTQKNTGAVITHASFLFVHSVSNICSVVANFPAKRLRKNTVLKNTHAPIFFFYILCLYLIFYIFNKGCFHVLELYPPEKS